MKKIFKKNQLVITALALMIAVAGYFSYMNNNIDDPAAKETSADAGTSGDVSTSADVLEEDYEISDEDSMVGEIFTDEGTGEELAVVDTTETAALDESADTLEDGMVAENGETDSDTVADADTAAGENVADADTAAGEDVADAGTVGNPGEAVLTSTTINNLDYAAEMKLNREQIRSKNKEALLEIVNNTSLADNLKQEAVNKMVAMTDIAEREAAAEMLLEAKGFTDVVVSITDDNCDVVLNMGEVTDSKRAQVEDIVKRKTNVSAEKIVITPIVVTETE